MGVLQRLHANIICWGTYDYKRNAKVVGGLGYAVALQVPILTLIDISAAWLHYRSLDWQTVIILLPLSFVGMYVSRIARMHTGMCWRCWRCWRAGVLCYVGCTVMLTVSVCRRDDI